MTSNQFTVIAGKNGSGKSQLLTLASNRGGSFLQRLGYRSYFPNEQTVVSVSGPKRTHLITSARTIAKDVAERSKGPYTFDELARRDETNKYLSFRKTLSRFALQADAQFDACNMHRDPLRQVAKAEALKRLRAAFTALFPGLSIEVNIDHAAREVSLFAARQGMSFIRASDPNFYLRVPFATLSDGELNTLALLFDIAELTAKSQDPLLILIDEIENHLHPALISRFISQLQRFLPPFAMLIASTHSPQVIAATPPESRVLMIHSTELPVTKSRNQLLVSSSDAGASRLFYELYGAESAATATDFLRDLNAASKAEMLLYAQDSLRESHAFSGSAAADPQRTFLTGLVHAKRAAGQSLQVLDVGAGQGRLVKGLRADLASAHGESLVFDLVEPSMEYRQHLLALKSENTSAVTIRDVHESIAEIPTTTKYDLILFHNVVHEIPASQLLSVLLGAASRLAASGIINVLEQAVLPQGERRYFVFTPEALSRFLQQLGFDVTSSSRVSRSGVPIYELSARKTDSKQAVTANAATALCDAIDETIRTNMARYSIVANDLSKPVELAFLAFNIVNGQLAKQQLLANLGANDG